MNFAFGAIVIFFLLLPGGTVLKAYYTSVKEKKSSISIPLNDLLARGLVFSFLIHSTGLFILSLFHQYPRVDLIYNLISGVKLESFVDQNKDLIKCFLVFSLYNIIINAAAWLITKAAKTFIQNNNLDINYYSLRNINYWFYIFSGRYLEAQYEQGEQINADLIYLNVLCKGDLIYSGFLHDFNYSPQKDELENIVLTNIKKRCVTKTENNIVLGLPVNVDGEFFLILASEIVNINITYTSVPEEGEEESATAEKPTTIIEA